jgi:hypothetical protein
MRAQHVVAVEHGFQSWEAIAKASSIEVRLAITLAKLPELNTLGIGLLWEQGQQPKVEQQAIYEKHRAQLRKSVVEIDATVSWLRENVRPTKTINTRHTSYGWKAVAEKDIGYITNGMFIAAGIIAGYPYEIKSGSPNVPFGMSEVSLRKLEMRREQPARELKRFISTAVTILRRRGIHAHAGSGEGDALVWSEDGDVRTLRLGTVKTSPFIVRVSVDCNDMLVSQKASKALGEAVNYGMAKPVRPKGEISLLPSEVDAALEWALNYDARRGTPPLPPPFDKSAHSRPSSMDAWAYVWSQRAWAANAWARGTAASPS